MISGFWSPFEKIIGGSRRVKKDTFDTQHRVRSASPLPHNTEVWITDGQLKVEGQMIAPAGATRFYLVSADFEEIDINSLSDQRAAKDTKTFLDDKSLARILWPTGTLKESYYDSLTYKHSCSASQPIHPRETYGLSIGLFMFTACDLLLLLC